jgi:peptidoglycan hydrolase CwlO-like protein
LQHQFITFVAAPLWHTLEDVFPEIHSLLDNLENNKTRWEELIRQLEKEEEERLAAKEAAKAAAKEAAAAAAALSKQAQPLSLSASRVA